MLKVKLINEAATLNNFSFLEIKEYIPNLPLSIKIQIMDSEANLRLIPGTTAKLNATFQNQDGGELVVAGVMLFNPDDRSLWHINLTSVQSNQIVGSNFRIDLDFNGSSVDADLSDSTDLRSGMGYSLLGKITFDGEC